MKEQNKKTARKAGFGIGVVAAVLFILWFGAIALMPHHIPPDTPTTKLTSSFTLIDYNTGEDVSAWVEISIWTPDPDDLPFDDEDPYRQNNFDEKISSSDASDVAIDLRSYNMAWLEIDPDFESDYGGYNGVYNPVVSNDFRLLAGGANYDYLFYVYHLPTNVSLNVLKRASNEVDLDGNTIFDDMNEWNRTATTAACMRTNNGTYTVYLNMPWNNTKGLHAGVVGGDEWDIDDDEFDDMTESELFWLRDQTNFRTIAPFYDLQDDDGKDYDDELELVTNCFAVNFTFNDSVSTLDDTRTQVNFTLSERDYNEIPAEVVYSAESILVIFYEPITCYNHLYNFDFKISIDVDINCTSVTSGRIFTPYDDDNLGAWTQINQAPIFDNSAWDG